MTCVEKYCTRRRKDIYATVRKWANSKINIEIRSVTEIDNKIYVFVKENNTAILKYPKFNIETTAYIGKNGVTNEKREGDGKTPLGEFELGVMLGTHLNIKNANGITYKTLTKDMYWVDDSKSKYYNQLVNISEVKKDWNSAEHLIDYPIQYEYLIEIKTNPNNVPNKGSAIFLHCTNNKATEGCIAVNKETMKKLVENINQQTKIEICKINRLFEL